MDDEYDSDDEDDDEDEEDQGAITVPLTISLFILFCKWFLADFNAFVD